ncbi:hypothetical protein D3874_14195 [Oleomonas cavernae]|uniref:Lipoprotein n=1 Tax=Oleomonas cavernae TaxID=2320859 RepID=A0A418WDJ2_9PROT|nr:hypothetical protein [Oleomonas cavernae]RJF88026.1 hypothetical protein D3874_14195 [Oleomonas cavernae]
MEHRSLILGLIGLGLAATGLAGCANPRAEAAAQAQTSLVGLRKADLLSCAGAPAAAMQANPGEEVLTYESRKVSGYASGPSFGLGFFGGGGNVGYGLGLPLGGSSYVDDDNCRASFTIRNGAVTRIVYGGSDASYTSRLAQCYQIVENCLPRG